MANKFPISQSFQRLTNLPLDPSETFATLEEAENYAMNGLTSYTGQIVYIKDVRTSREIQEGVSKKDGLFIIDQYKTLRPFFKFVLSTLQMDTGEGLSYNGIQIDDTDVSSILGGAVSDEVEEISNDLQYLINEFNDYKDHTHVINDIDRLETKLDDMQDEIDTHTHNVNDVLNLDTKVEELVNESMQNITPSLDEDRIHEIIEEYDFLDAYDVTNIQLELQRNTAVCIERHKDATEALAEHKEEALALFEEHKAEELARFESHVEDFNNHYHTIGEIKGDNEGDNDLATELALIKEDIVECNEKIENNYQEFIEFKTNIEEDFAEFKALVEQQLGDIAALLDEINGEII
jgi:hypothetical protein